MALRREIEIQADPTRYKLGPARLFLDDVQLIYKTVQEAAREKAQDSQDNEPPTVDILAGDAVGDSPDDLREAKPEELQRVRIITSHPAILVDLGRRDASVLTSDADMKDLARAIRDFVNRRRSVWASFFFWGPPEFGLIGVLLIICTPIVIAGTHGKPRFWVQALIFSALVLIAGVGMTFWTIYRQNGIRVVPRKESESRGLSLNPPRKSG